LSGDGLNPGWQRGHDKDEIVIGQPIAHVDRHQHRLITLRSQEVLRHTP
jgi:hypothetical protein